MSSLRDVVDEYKSLFTSIADAIRTKKEVTYEIAPSAMPEEILTISGGDQAQLNAPTISIESMSAAADVIQIVNGNNGTFCSAYDIYVDDVFMTSTQLQTDLSTTFDLRMIIHDVGDYVITVSATGNLMTESDPSNSLSYHYYEYASVMNDLTNCRTSNPAENVAIGTSYSARISAFIGFTMDDAYVKIMMNGVDITAEAYANQRIYIAEVTGALVIEAVAVESLIDALEFNADEEFTFNTTEYLFFDGTLQVSTNGNDWIDLASNHVSDVYTAELQQGKYRLLLRGKGNTHVYSYMQTNSTSAIRQCLSFSKNVHCSGNIMTLIDHETTTSDKALSFSCLFAFTTITSTPDFVDMLLRPYAFAGMFYNCSSLTNVASLPKTQFSRYCYIYMFGNCTSLTIAPDLPVTTLAEGCYYGMFSNCRALTEAPNLPATTLVDHCYEAMFSGCASLINAPALPATEAKVACYEYMFADCTSLTTAPELPAITLANGCYRSMFHRCTALVNPPELPALTVISNCYSSMFAGCTSLKTAPNLPATDIKDYCYSHMFANCTSLKTAPLRLPAMTLAIYCYSYMFYKCESLTKAPELPALTLATCCYENMFFGCSALVNPPELHATTMAYRSCYCMFYSCASLTTAPELPAMTLAQSCYHNMFSYCTALVNPPELPALVTAPDCYYNMFSDCTALVSAPNLPATDIKDYCYSHMFAGCTSLKTAPLRLPAMTLAIYCYSYMFYKCESLTKAPELPATTLAVDCYSYMFYGCRSLEYPPALPATMLASSCYAYMFKCSISLHKMKSLPYLPATELKDHCYLSMFEGISMLGLYTSSTPDHPYEYRIPTSGTGTTATSALSSMFTGGEVPTPSINTTYYVANPPIG